MPTAFAHWRAVNHRGFVRLPDQHLGLPGQARDVLDAQRTLTCCRWYDANRDHQRRVVFTVVMRAPSLLVPASVKPLLSFL